MNTYEHSIPNWELGAARRWLRGIIGAASLFAILLIPNLSAAWLFVLAMIGGYQSLTAILNADLIYAVVSPDASAPVERSEKVGGVISTEEQFAY
jgi:hypothetical protein